MKNLLNQRAFSILEVVISMVGAGILLSGGMAAMSWVNKSNQAVSFQGKKIDYANFIKTQVSCEQTLRNQTPRCNAPLNAPLYVYLRNSKGENLTNRTRNGSLFMENLYLRAKCSDLSGHGSGYKLDIEHQFTQNGTAPVETAYTPFFKIPFACGDATPPPPPGPRTLTAMRIPGGCFKARHGGSRSNANGMNGKGDYPVECSFEMDLSEHTALRSTDTVESIRISYTTGAAPFNCHVGGNCYRGNVQTPADFSNYMPHSLWAAADNLSVVFNTDANGEGPILISGDEFIHPAERTTMRNFIRNKASQGGFRCFYDQAINYYSNPTYVLNVASVQTITKTTDTFRWNPDTKRLRITNRRFDPNQFAEDLVGSSRWDYAAGACLGDFTVTLTVSSP